MLTRFIADSVTKPGSSPVFGNPKDFGLEYEDVTFKASDGVTLSAWLVKGKPDKVTIFSHFGIQSSRSGFDPMVQRFPKPYNEKIEYLNTIKHLVKEGYTVLMYDQRNHGNSDPGTCGWITGGVEESKDVIAAVEFISTHPTYKDSHIGLLSYCQGAGATTYAYGAENGLQQYKNIKALLVMQPMYSNATFLKAFGFPTFLVNRANRLNLKRGGKDLYQSCWPLVKNINVPTLVVQAEGDPWTDMDKVKEYYDNLQVEKEMFWIKGTKKRLASYDWFSHSPGRMLEFFNKHVPNKLN